MALSARLTLNQTFLASLIQKKKKKKRIVFFHNGNKLEEYGWDNHIGNELDMTDCLIILGLSESPSRPVSVGMKYYMSDD